MLKKLGDASIAVRLAAGFGVALLILVVQSAMGYFSATRSQAIVETSINAARTKQDLAHRLHDAALLEQLRLREAGVLVDVNALEHVAGQLRQTRTELHQVLTGLLALDLDASERELIERIEQITRSTQSAREEVLRLSLAMQTDQANEAYEKHLRKTDETRSELTARFVQLQRDHMDVAFGSIRDLAGNAMQATVAMALLGMLVAATAGVLLYRSVTRPLNEVVRVANQMAAGDLSARLRADEQHETGRMLHALGRMADGTRSAFVVMRSGSDMVLEAASAVAAASAQLSTRSGEHSRSLQLAAGAMDQLVARVRHSSELAHHAQATAQSAAAVARAGGEQVTRLVATMEQISASSRSMADMVETISGIAFRTNLLALNAAVEAAAAGAKGRGFAVVADEVRLLAQRAADAAKEIKEVIAVNDSAVTAGTAVASQVGAGIAQTVQASADVSAVIGQIASSSSEQARDMEQTNSATSEVDKGLQGNVVLVAQLTAAAQGLRAQAESLNTELLKFKLD